MSTLEDLLADQDQAMNAVSRALPNFKKLGKAKWTASVIRNRLTSLKEAFAECKEFNARICRLATTEHRATLRYFVSNLFLKCEDIYNDAADYMADALGSVEPPHSPLNISLMPDNTPKPPSRLPQIDLPSFDGTLTQWETFRDRFRSLVHNDKSLSNVDRLHYLCSAVKGDASRTLSHLAITDANFDIAWQTLVKRFENKRRLVKSHVENLLNLPQVASENVHDLHSLIDQFTAIVQALKNLELPVEHWDALLVPIITQKLDKNSRRVWEMKLGKSSDIPSVADLTEFLEAHVYALDALLPSSSEKSDKGWSKSQRPKAFQSYTTTTKVPACPLCKGDHPLHHCKKLKEFSPVKRLEAIRTMKRCFNCLSSSHMLTDCTSHYRCRYCQQAHHSLLHNSQETASRAVLISAKTDDAPVETVSAHCSSNFTRFPTKVLFATARVQVGSSSGRFLEVRAILDQGSAVTLITEGLARRLRLKRRKQSFAVRGVGETPTLASEYARIRVSPARSSRPALSTSAIILRSLPDYEPDHASRSSLWEHVANLPLADPNPFSNEPFDILIGSDLYGYLLKSGVRQGKRGEPIAQNSILGWILSGPVSPSTFASSVHSLHIDVSNDCLEHLVRRFWEVENVPEASAMSAEERLCEQHFLSTHRRSDDGRYIVRLPLKTSPPLELGDSRRAAMVILRRLQRQLHSDPERAEAYAAFMKEYEALGHMTRVVTTEPPSAPMSFYIPHHAVVRESSSTSKLRVVFNASCSTSSGKSLNDHLHVGPKLQTDLSAIILRWRQYKFVLTADIAKMYRQILVDDRDLDFQRILWQIKPDSPVNEYRLRTVTYGTAAAPFLALRVLRQLAIDEGSQFPLAIPVLREQTYVDDCIFGADSLTEAGATREQLVALLSKGQFHLRKWASNCPELLRDIDPSDHGLACSKDLRLDEALKILGISWHPELDSFRFSVTQLNTPAKTKREMLSAISRIFDPLGWVTPTLIIAKILLQTLWRLRIGWDEVVPEAILYEWTQFHSQLKDLEKIIVPRWTFFDSKVCRAELHGFADASTAAYAAVVYLRVIPSHGPAIVSLLMAKSRVAPLKTLSVPRLELCAAHLLARVLVFASSALKDWPLTLHCWTDSAIVLAWLKQPSYKWKTFVANRVSAIQSSIESADWRHVSTMDNPADCASRGLTAGALAGHNLWWQGPPWLTEPEASWPQSFPQLSLEESEQRANIVALATTVQLEWDLQHRFSSWSKLLRVTAYILRFITRLKKLRSKVELVDRKSTTDNTVGLQPNEVDSARRFWLRYLQREMFPLELERLRQSREVAKSSPLAPLCPFLDEDGLLRVRGRLRNAVLPESSKTPIILKSHPLVHQLIYQLHVATLHAGSQLTLSLIRRDYWILRARAVVRSVLHTCLVCARTKAAVPEQLMGHLPECRVRQVPRAFVHTGVDYAGPFYVRSAPGRGYHARKAYLAVFICMTTKAIHLELVLDYTSNAFLAAFHRFVSRRGIPSAMYSDNGTTFQGADRELRSAHLEALSHPDFLGRLATDGVEWHFIPPAAPHFGGLWEAAVRSVKHHLKRCIGKHTLTGEELTTLLCRVEACLNSRPIAAASDNLDDYHSLTPGHFLIGAPLLASPEISVLKLPEGRLSRWQLVQRLHEDFWKSWQRDYLHTLQQRPKWRVRQQLATVGRLVLVADPNAPPTHWALGRIIACHPGNDQNVRVVTVKTATTELKRPIVKLCFLPVEINLETENQADSQ